MHEEVRLLVFGCKVSAQDLLETVGSEPRIVPVQDLLLALRRAYGKDSVRDFNTKGEFVARLYALLKGLTSPVDRREAESCMRAFVNSIAYRPPEDLDGLIREEILEADDNSAMIETLKTTIMDIANLRQDADRLAKNVERLEELRNEVSSTVKDLVEEWMFAHLAAAWQHRDAVTKRNAELVKIDEAKREVEAFQGGISDIERQIVTRKEVLRRLQEKLRESGVYKVRVELETKISLGEHEIEQFGDRLKSAGLKLVAMRNAVIEVSRNMSGIEALTDVVTKLEEAKERLAAVDIPALNGHFLAARDGLGGENPGQGLREAIPVLDRAIGAGWLSEFGENSAIWPTITDARDQLRVTRRETHDAQEVKRARLGQLRLGRVPYPPATTSFLSYLLDVLPECNPRILCDVIEMRDPAWQGAIEGFIGGDRYSIIYDPYFESRVISMLRRYIPGGRTRPVAQLGEALKEAANVQRGSLVEKLKSDDDVALGFLKARYGRSICVATELELMGLRSGLLRDGVSVHAFQYRNRSLNEDELVFGAEVRRRQAQLLEELIRAADREIAELDERASRVREADSVLQRVRHEEDLQTLDVERLVEAGTTMRSLRIELQQLDDSDIRELELKIASEETAISEADREKMDLYGKQVTASNNADAAARKAEELDAEIDRFEPEMLRTERNWREVLETVAELKRPLYEASFREEIESGRPLKSFVDRSADRRGDVLGGKSEIDRMIRDYNRDARPFQQVTLHLMNYEGASRNGRAMSEWLHLMEGQVHRQLQLQRDTGLVEKHSQLQLAEQRFTTAFTTNFCARILNKVDGRDDTYEQINQALSSISFSGDRVTMVQSVKDEYSSYLDLLRAIKASSNTGAPDLFSEGERFTDEQKATLEELRTLLLSDDTEYSMKELGRIADHRNYKRYDFNRSAKGGEHKSMSTWGTGSGGEAETPYYIIRAAVFAAAFKLFGQQKTAHFRTMILDEVFQKMDETRTRRVLRFLTEDMRLQVICAAPTKSMAALLDSFDKRVSFAKSPEPRSLSWIDEVDIDQERVREIYEAHRRNTVERVTAEFEISQVAASAAEAAAAE
ncbi:SbcC/MukB-like Walker B domain-containing protein [Mesorhizobium amorphae]|uniref:SbcC/MukB-like Walker B domain-containing protein n=1 Tax=Mesorhizobium amorphae TaxID=71433 RepID=UPI0017804E98